MKVVIRADDVGYSKVHNLGTFEASENGVVTSADVMLDTPGTEDALERLRDHPWISVGWHTHFWGSPVLHPSEVPSLVEKSGRFRKDPAWLEDVVYEEALKEFRAEIERCIRILGRAPDTGICAMPEGMGPANFNFKRPDNAPVQDALRKVCEEFGIPCDYAGREDYGHGERKVAYAKNEKFAGRKIVIGDSIVCEKALFSDSITALFEYNPLKFYLDDVTHIIDGDQSEIKVTPWHPGYVDYYVAAQGDRGPFSKNFLLSRTFDCFALCSDELKTWIRENKVELINHRDALYGTNEYQNHLRATGSDLCII